MTSAPNLTDIHWLIGPEAAPFLQAAKEDARPLHQQAQALRKGLSAERAHLILEQVDLRHRAAAKFRLAEQMFFARTSLEQATDEATAAYKAQRFPQPGLLADMCCGIGGDLLALAARSEVVGIERDPAIAALAEANLKVCLGEAQSAAQVRVGDVMKFDLSTVSAWQIDPDRRPAGTRTTRVELHEPGSQAISALLKQNPHGAIKLSPAAEAPAEWADAAELEWISREGSCRQLVVWCGELAQAAGQRRATVLAGTGEVRRTVCGLPVSLALAGQVGRYLYEPDAAILAAELTGPVAVELGLQALIPGGGYLTSDRPLNDGALAGFEVMEVMPLQIKPLKAWLQARSIGRLEVKKRGVDHDPERLRQELRCRGENAATLIVTRMPNGFTAILARRI